MTDYGPDEKEHAKTCPLLSTVDNHCPCLADKCMWFRTSNKQNNPNEEPIFISYCIVYPLVENLENIVEAIDRGAFNIHRSIPQI